MIDYQTGREWRAFLRAILASPADDLPRLVAADWLEEREEVAVAEFIRLQCAGDHFAVPPPWLSPVIESLLCRQSQECHQINYTTGSFIYRGGQNDMRWVKYTRGFVCEVQCTIAQWMTHGARIVREQPIERVMIFDREPWAANGRWYWHKAPNSDRGSSHWASELPLEIWWCDDSLISPYLTVELARVALSDALIRWAKGKSDCQKCGGEGWCYDDEGYYERGWKRCPDCR